MQIPSPILAAGAVVLRASPDDGAAEVLVIHRAGYDDWTLPKGHADEGELLPVAAVREVHEETGVPIRLGARLEVSRYPVNGHPKEVHWWVGTPTGEQVEPPDDEADRVEWWPVGTAEERLTFETDQQLVARAAELAHLVPFLVVRHGKALSRSKWRHADVRRPLTRRGRRQSKVLAALLAAFGVESVQSSAAVRCADTLVPYARRIGTTVVRHEELTEHAAAADPITARDLTRALALAAVDSGSAGVVCGHRPVLPLMLEGLGVDNRPFGTADCLVAYLDRQAQAVLSDHFKAALPEKS